jgi:hypothetical protein
MRGKWCGDRIAVANEPGACEVVTIGHLCVFKAVITGGYDGKQDLPIINQPLIRR